MASGYSVTINPLKVAELPAADKVIAEARSIIESTTSWKQGKTFHKVVRTYSRPKAAGESAAWHCRVSEHGPEDATFDELWEKLGVNKGENEVYYVEEVKKATLVKQIPATQSIWTMYYRFPPPVTPRVFTVLQTTVFNDASPRSAMIVSIPVDLSGDPELAKLEEKGVKGRYVSVELIKELPDGKVEWRMATSSRAEGSLPQIFTERAMATSISHDVPGLLKYLHSLRPSGKENKKPADEPQTEDAPAVLPHGPAGIGGLV